MTSTRILLASSAIIGLTGLAGAHAAMIAVPSAQQAAGSVASAKAPNSAVHPVQNVLPEGEETPLSAVEEPPVEEPAAAPAPSPEVPETDPAPLPAPEVIPEPVAEPVPVPENPEPAPGSANDVPPTAEPAESEPQTPPEEPASEAPDTSAEQNPDPAEPAPVEPDPEPEPTAEPTPEAEPQVEQTTPSEPETAPDTPEAPVVEPEEPAPVLPGAEVPADVDDALQDTVPESPQPEAPKRESPALDEEPVQDLEENLPSNDADATTQDEPAADASEAEDGEAAPVDPETPAEPVDPPAAPEEADGSDQTENAPATESTDQPDAGNEQQAAPGQEAPVTLPVENSAPVLDSQKEPEDPADGEPDRQESAPAPAEDSGPPPASDEEAQGENAGPAPEQALSEPGERIDGPPASEEPANVTIINRTDNRTVIEVDNRTIVRSDDRGRLRTGADDVYYERLSGGRIREVVVRPNGVQLVTITNRWGDVVQRSRIMPDGREYVLFYDRANTDGSRQPFRDPGRNLPPLRLNIPVEEYILDATQANPSAFLNFLLEPPVERVERLYSIDEVRSSARLRDMVRRVDLDSLTFDTGKATISPDQIDRLSKVATAMTEVLDRNPAETFLIEGHTDAIGSDQSNLVLSDQRADTIAVALTTVFGIPPENLVTQGYGERYLKIQTQEAERLNRRVTIRRITPLVSPVASR
ncbi:MAG: OmpA family protein [Hoeflea sp.]|uniref:OmpA family protein n=1 Tax=Hoeflea sp. TaxID=1940281 RepID=UPI0032EC0D09